MVLKGKQPQITRVKICSALKGYVVLFYYTRGKFQFGQACRQQCLTQHRLTALKPPQTSVSISNTKLLFSRGGWSLGSFLHSGSGTQHPSFLWLRCLLWSQRIFLAPFHSKKGDVKDCVESGDVTSLEVFLTQSHSTGQNSIT